jgi:HlyD family secretion protein
MKTAIKILVGVSALLLLVAEGSRMDLLGTPGKDEKIPITAAKPRDLLIEVNTIGVLDAAASHMVTSALSNARIIDLIDDGSRVKAGDVLVRLDSTAYQEAVDRLKGECRTLESAVSAKKQLLEWEKNQVAKEIQAAEYQIRVARLDLEQIQNGEGPLQLARLAEEVKEQRDARSRYQSYVADLKRLQKQDFDFALEQVRAEEKLAQLSKALDSARSKYVNYRDHMLPALVEKAKAEVEQARTALDQTRKGGVYKIAQAAAALEEIRGKLENTEKALGLAEEKLDCTIIRAPSAGIVILYAAFREGTRRKPRIGDIILQNQPILYLPDVSSMVVETRIREVDLHKVNIGQPCDVFVDAYPEETMSGTVDFIGSLATDDHQARQSGKYFNLTIEIAGPNTRLRPGMTARVRVLAEQAENILTLPLHAVFGKNGRPYCYRFTGRGFERVEVRLGRRNLHFVEITSGLAPGEQVALARPSDSSDA